MKSGWLAAAGPYNIHRVLCPHPAEHVNLSAPPTGVLHTTEGSFESAMSVFRSHYAPHFLVGRGTIAQLVPLGFMAAALENRAGGVETNRLARVQIEVAGFSRTVPYDFDPKTQDALAALLAALVDAADIPLARPFPDAMPPGPWATPKFSRRNAGKWGHVAGWYGHVEVPENDHWDPGALRWGTLLDAARQKRAPSPEPAPVYPRDPRFWLWLRWRLGEGGYKRWGPMNLSVRPRRVPLRIPTAWWQAAQMFVARRRDKS